MSMSPDDLHAMLEAEVERRFPGGRLLTHLDCAAIARRASDGQRFSGPVAMCLVDENIPREFEGRTYHWGTMYGVAPNGVRIRDTWPQYLVRRRPPRRWWRGEPPAEYAMHAPPPDPDSLLDGGWVVQMRPTSPEDGERFYAEAWRWCAELFPEHLLSWQHGQEAVDRGAP